MEIVNKVCAEDAQKRAVDRVEAHAKARFMIIAYRAGVYLAGEPNPFTSGDLRDLITTHYPGVSTHDDRALGAVMRRLSRKGLIAPTGRYIKSERRRNHNRPMREWVGTRINESE